QLTAKGQNLYSVTFQLNEYCDVAVSIVDPSDSTIVRHLAAGVLGPKAGLPFTANALTQTLEWDGTDDIGNPVANAASMKVRIRAGMSVRLVNLEGDNPYNFRPANYRAGKISGMVSDDSGYVYIQGMPSPLFSTHTSMYAETIRKYDRNGNYIRTVFPFPAGLAPSKVRQWGVRYKEDSTYFPQHSITTMPSISTTLLSPYGRYNSGNGFCQLIPLNKNGELVLGSLYNHIKFNTDGSINDSTSPSLLKSPVLPPKKTTLLMNSTYFGTSRNLNYYYISGNFEATASSGQLTAAVDTGLFRDGRIYKVDKTTGVGTLWYAYPDSIPLARAARITALGGSSTDAVYGMYHGTAVDAQGRVYVCDRLKKRLAVYDSSANFLGAVNIGYFPENVVVSPATGAIYVATKQANSTGGTGIVRLYKFGPWNGSTTAICSLEVTKSFSGGIGIAPNPVYLHLDERGTAPRIWLGFSGCNVR
ncbi:MAG: hypothetical protein JNL74_09575, partial [Fibrobacteres bacterium]|nr:hypothetical protein [Fibrobacterota bacterium]